MTTAARLRHGNPIWLREAGVKFAPLKGAYACDVVVVGGGITGVLISVMFAAAGVSVSVLEADRVGAGSTVASSALLLQEPDHGIGELARRYGRVSAARIWRLSHDAVSNFITMMNDLRIDCDLVMRDAVYYARSTHAVKRLRAEFIARDKAGFEGEWLGPRALRDITGITGHGAIKTRGSGQFDPWKACRGLLDVAAASGAHVFERTAVTRIERRGRGVRVRTPRGHVDASRAIIATGYATPEFRPLAGRFRLFHTYVLATVPLDKYQRREVGLSDVMTWDTDRPYHYSRWTADHRLLLGGGDRRIPGRGRRGPWRARDTDALRDHFEALWPALAGSRLETAWAGVFATTPDSLPYIGSHARYPNHLFALGYGGNGMTFAYLAARMLLEQWQGHVSPDHRLFRFGRLR